MFCSTGQLEQPSHYDFTPEGSGKDNDKELPAYTHASIQGGGYHWSSKVYPLPPTSFPYSYKPDKGYGTIKIYDIKAACTWNRSQGTSQIAPEYVTLKVSSQASASATYAQNSTPNIRVSLDNGLESSTDAPALEGPYNGRITKRWKTAPTAKLIRVSAKGGTWTSDYQYQVYIPLNITVTAREDVTMSDISDADIRLSTVASSAIDPRHVYISSPTIENSYRRTEDSSKPIERYRNNKKPSDYDCTIVQAGAGLLNEATEADKRTVNSVASWDEPSQTWMGQGVYQGHWSGFIAPTVRWSVDGGQLHGDASIDINPHGDIYNALHCLSLGGSPDGTGMISSTTINLKVTDSDGLSLPYAYTVRWHLPYEKMADLSDGSQQLAVLQNVVSGVTAGQEVAAKWVEPTSFTIEGLIDDVLVVADGTGLPAGQLKEAKELFNVFKAIMRLTTFDYEEPGYWTTETTVSWNDGSWDLAVDGYTKGHTGLIDFDGQNPSDFKYPIGHPHAGKWDMSKVRGKFVMDVKNVKLYHFQNKLADKYDVHGFHTPNHFLKAEKVEDVKLVAYFRYAPLFH